MSETILISERGQITLPTAIRKKYALTKDTPLILEDTGEGLLLRKVSMIPLKTYSEEDVKAWTQEDAPQAKDRKWLRR